MRGKRGPKWSKRGQKWTKRGQKGVKNGQKLDKNWTKVVSKGRKRKGSCPPQGPYPPPEVYFVR